MVRPLPEETLRLGRRGRMWLLGAAGVVAFGLVAADLGLAHYGLPSDEAFYHAASRRHVEWLLSIGTPGSFSEETLRRHFAWMPQVVVHPNFSRWLSGLSWLVFHRGLGVDEIVAFRLHNAIAYALVGMGITGFVLRRVGTLPALVALLLFLGSPRFFGHAHTAMTDVPLSALWLFSVLLLVRGLEADRPGAVLGAACLSGLALATKLTGLQLVLILAGWSAVARPRRAALFVPVLLLLPPLVFLLLDPQTWHDPLGWWRRFLADFAAREQVNRIPTLVLGERYGHRVPWYVPTLHALVTLSPVVIALSAVAALHGLRRLASARRRELTAWLRGPWPLCVLAGLSPIAVASLPAVPAHDQERLFLHAQPFLVIFAAVGFAVLARSEALAGLGRALPGRRAAAGAWLLAAICCAPPLVATLRAHPYPLGYFNALVGGARGAERLGFDPVYLKLEANERVLDALNALPRGASLFANFLLLDLALHQEAGRLRDDLRLVSQPPADFAVIHARRSWMSPFEERLWTQREPDWALRHRGVDLVRIYRLAAGS